MRSIKQVNLKWGGGESLAFTVEPTHSEQNAKEMLLNSLGLCTGMTLVALFNKMRLNIETLEIDVIGVITDNPPTPQSLFVGFEQIIRLTTPLSDAQQRFSHAVAITHDRYCAVTLMVKKIAQVDITLFINAQEIEVKEN